MQEKMYICVFPWVLTAKRTVHALCRALVKCNAYIYFEFDEHVMLRIVNYSLNLKQATLSRLNSFYFPLQGSTMFMCNVSFHFIYSEAFRVPDPRFSPAGPEPAVSVFSLLLQLYSLCSRVDSHFL